MQNIFFRICLFPLTLVFSTLCWLCVGLGKNNAVSHRLECLWGRLVLLCGGIRVTADLSALTPETTYVFFANHQSNLDIPALFAALSGYNFRFLAKESLFRIPVFGPAMARWAMWPSNGKTAARPWRASPGPWIWCLGGGADHLSRGHPGHGHSPPSAGSRPGA
jgi:hypothetical protein